MKVLEIDGVAKKSQIYVYDNVNRIFVFVSGSSGLCTLYSGDNVVLGAISATVPRLETCTGCYTVPVGLRSEGKETVHVCSGRRKTE